MSQNNQDNIRIGIDLGGTKIEAIALDKSGSILLRTRIKSPKGSYDETVRAIVALIHQVEFETGRTGSVGIGIPGSISKRTGLIKGANSTWLIGKPLNLDIAEALERPIRLANDANCFALSEAADGNAKEFETVFGVILGTGVGGGLVIKGMPINGLNGIAGEWGHNPLPAHTQDDLPLGKCYCGRHGCIETFVSGPALEKSFTKTTMKHLTATEIADLADTGDSQADKFMRQYDDRLARSLASVINIFDPDAIVLGGGLSKMQRLYKNIPDIWEKYIFSDHVDTQLLPPAHGDSSGVRGAAWLWSDGEYSRIQHVEKTRI